MATGLARTLSLEVYLNYDDEGGAPVSGHSTAMQCSQDVACAEATDCAGTSAKVKASWLFSSPLHPPLDSTPPTLYFVSSSFLYNMPVVVFGSKRNGERERI